MPRAERETRQLTSLLKFSHEAAVHVDAFKFKSLPDSCMNAILPKSFAGFTPKPPKFWPRRLIGLVTGAAPKVQAPCDTA